MKLTRLIPQLVIPFVFTGSVNAQLGMTNAIDPPVEPCSIQKNQLNPNLPTGFLTQSYRWAQGPQGPFLENNPNNGAFTLPSEQNGRLHYFLRDVAGLAASPVTAANQSVLVEAVLLYLGLTKPAIGSVPAINADSRAVAAAVAQIAVTGRRAYANFASWHPQAGALSGPQDADLIQLVKKSSPTVDPIVLQRAVSFVLDTAYSALWAIRSNDPIWRAKRAQMGWIAVSGEDDTPHRPVNVPTAPYPQYDLPVSVSGPYGTITATTRYMVASYKSYLGPDPPPYGFPPLPQSASTGNAAGKPLSSGDTFATGVHNGIPGSQISYVQYQAPRQLPVDGLPSIPLYPNLKIIVYVHGGGSRLEEAVPLADNLILEAMRLDPKRISNDNYVVISFDMPNSAYGDAFDPAKVYGTTYHPSSFNILKFEEQYVINFIEALDQKVGNIKNRVAAVMGGSLGGNTSLLLSRENLQAHPYLKTIVAWSPTSIIPSPKLLGSGDVGKGIVKAGNVSGANWDPEEPNTRAAYFQNLYFASTSNIAGIPPDPQMWYREGWMNADNSLDCKKARIVQSRFDRYEVYSSSLRRWTTAIDTEQAMYSFQDEDSPGSGPRYKQIGSRVLLAAGEKDCYRFGCNGNVSPGNLLLADTLDIYGFTHDVANKMATTPGRTLFIKNTGHSIHDERPAFFAREIVSFLTEPDINLSLTLSAGNTGLRWNSTLYAFFNLANGGGDGLDLNAWWHPYPPFNVSPDNPCGACGTLDHFELHPNTTYTFTWGLSRGSYNVTDMRTFGINFIHGSRGGANAFDMPDSFALNGVSLNGVEGLTGTVVSASGQPLTLLTASVGIWQTSQITQPQIVHVQPPPARPGIISQPQNDVVTLGQTARFAVIASGATPLSYQWQRNGTAIRGATSSSYVTPAAVTTSDLGAEFAVVVSNSVGNVTSSTATIIGQLSATVSSAGTVSSGITDTVTLTSGGTPLAGVTVTTGNSTFVTNASGVVVVTHAACMSGPPPRVGEAFASKPFQVPCKFTGKASKPGYQTIALSLP